MNIFSVPGTVLHTCGEQQTIWVSPRWFLPQEQPRKKVRLATVGASGQALATGRRTLGESGHRTFMQCGWTEPGQWLLRAELQTTGK